MTEEEKDKLITTYLSGRASEAEARQVERSRTQDPAFQVELEEQQTLWRAIGPSRVNEFRKVVAEVMNEQRPKNGGASFHAKPRIIALAALLLLSVIACWWVFTPGADPQNRLYDQYFSVPAPTACNSTSEIHNQYYKNQQPHREEPAPRSAVLRSHFNRAILAYYYETAPIKRMREAVALDSVQKIEAR